MRCCDREYGSVFSAMKAHVTALSSVVWSIMENAAATGSAPITKKSYPCNLVLNNLNSYINQNYFTFIIILPKCNVN